MIRNGLVISVLCMLLAGCAGSVPRLEVVRVLPDEYATCRVAVLPFGYQGRFPRGENIFYKAFTAEIAKATNFDIVPEGDVLEVYRQLRMYRKTRPGVERLRVIGRRLKADLIITGEILRLEEKDSGRYVQTALTIIARIHDGDSGHLLWTTYHKRRGKEYQNVLHYGRVNSISGLARRMSDEIITLWIDEGLKQCAQ